MTILIQTNRGTLAQQDGTLYLLTPCCGDTATNTADGTTCRSCNRQIDPFYGKTASTEQPDFAAEAEAFLTSAR